MNAQPPIAPRQGIAKLQALRQIERKLLWLSA